MYICIKPNKATGHSYIVRVDCRQTVWNNHLHSIRFKMPSNGIGYSQDVIDVLRNVCSVFIIININHLRLFCSGSQIEAAMEVVD